MSGLEVPPAVLHQNKTELSKENARLSLPKAEQLWLHDKRQGGQLE